MHFFHPTAEWKWFLLWLLIAYLLVSIIRSRLTRKYTRLVAQFRAGTWDGLYAQCADLTQSFRLAAGGPLNRWSLTAQNNLKLICASIAYCNGDVQTFLIHLQDIKPDGTNAQRSSYLALYYRSIQDNNSAQEFYSEYMQCKVRDPDVTLILEAAFSAEEDSFDTETIRQTFSKIENPALRALMVQNIPVLNC